MADEWQKAPIVKDDGGLDFVDKAVLGGVHLATKLGIGGEAAKMYDRVVYQKNMNPITIDDISPEMRIFLKNIVEAKAKDTGKTEGIISYQDYRKYAPDVDPENFIKDVPISSDYRNSASSLISGSIGSQTSQTLGAFRYEKSDKGISIKDSYDFNLYQKPAENAEARAAAAPLNPIGAMINVGRKAIPPGKGVAVDIQLPTSKKQYGINGMGSL